METIESKAKFLLNVIEEKKNKEQNDHNKLLEAKKEELLNQFELGFKDVLHLLRGSGISYTAGLVNEHFTSGDSFIEFHFNKSKLRMDFENARSYRYESTGKGGYPTSHYAHWDLDQFIIWIYKDLIQKDYTFLLSEAKK